MHVLWARFLIATEKTLDKFLLSNKIRKIFQQGEYPSLFAIQYDKAEN